MKTSDVLPARELTRNQKLALGTVAVLMVAVGGIGAFGTFTNTSRVFPDDGGTAAGVVAAGEGATLILALTQVSLTLLGQSTPLMVRVGLWVLPAVASVTCAVMANGLTQTLVYGVTPMAMCVSAEGLGLVARRVVVYCTGVDIEAQRRSAQTTRKVAFKQAVAANHPDKEKREKALRRSWALAAKVGAGDDQLGVELVGVQRERLTVSADTALARMLTVPVTAPATALPAGVTESESRHGEAVTAVTASGSARPALTAGETGETVPDTQVAAGKTLFPSQQSVTGETPVTDAPVTEDADAETPASHETGFALEDLASVAGVPVPVPGERLTDAQLTVVLRHLRYREDPPLSYRQAQTAFRDAGFVGGEGRIRKAWGDLLSAEETDTAQVPAGDESEDKGEADEDEPERQP